MRRRRPRSRALCSGSTLRDGRLESKLSIPWGARTARVLGGVRSSRLLRLRRRGRVWGGVKVPKVFARNRKCAGIQGLTQRDLRFAVGAEDQHVDAWLVQGVLERPRKRGRVLD